MILFNISRVAGCVAPGFLLLFGPLSDARAQLALDRGASPPPIEAPASAAVNKDPKSGDILVEEQGLASWYGRTWRGRRTASGARYDDHAMTAAHLWLPFATRARVTNLQNGCSVDVVVNDRGPYHEGRIIDLSARAAAALGIKRRGTAEVVVSVEL